MDWAHAIFKGILQGLTEFLPVSSTAHLIFTDALARLFHIPIPTQTPAEEAFFDILLHMGTLLAVLWYFRATLWQILQALRPSGTLISMPDAMTEALFRQLPPRRLVLYLSASMLTTIVWILLVLKLSEKVMTAMGWVQPGIVEDLSDYYLQHPQWVALHLFGTGCLLLLTEFLSARRQLHAATASQHNPQHGAAAATQDLPGFRLTQALWVGFAQGCAGIFHGISRSGSTISAGLLAGLDRVTATHYTFLLSIPTFLAALAYTFLKLLKTGGLASVHELQWAPMLAGMLCSAVVGYLCVKYFIQFVARHTLKSFALYCWGVSLLMFWVFR